MIKDSLQRFTPINTVCLMILAASAATWVLVYTRAMLMPFIIAVFIYMVASTLAGWLKQKWIQKSLANHTAGLL